MSDLNLRLVLKFLDQASPGLRVVGKTVSDAGRKVVDTLKPVIDLGAGLQNVGRDARDAVRPVIGVGEAVTQVGREAERAIRPLREVGRTATAMFRQDFGGARLINSLKNVGDRLGAVGEKLKRAGLWLGGTALGAGFFFKRQFIDAAAQFEDFRTQLLGLEGDSGRARRSMDWISNFAVKTPLELPDVVSAFIRLRTFGLDPTNGTLQALTDAAARMGGGAEQLQGIILALGQAWTKQKLQGDDVLQMLERGIPVWDLLAKKIEQVTGKKLTAQELMKMSEQGQLGRKSILMLIQAIGEANQGASEALSKNWKGILGNLKDAWYRWRIEVMDEGVFGWLKDKAQALLDWTNRMADNGRLRAWAKQTADALIQGFETAWRTGQRLLPVLRDIGGGVAELAHFLGGWRNLVIALAVLIGGALIASIVQAGIAIGGLAVVLATTPLGAFAAAVAGIAALAFVIYRNWGPIKAWFAKLWDGIKADFETAWGTWKARLESINPLPAIRDMIANVEDFLSRLDWSDLAKRVFQTFLRGLVPDFSGLIPQSYGAWQAQIQARGAGGGATALAPGRASIFDAPRTAEAPRGRIDLHLHGVPSGTRARNDSNLDLRLHPGLGRAMVTP